MNPWPPRLSERTETLLREKAMGVTDDPNHPGVQRGGPDEAPVPMHDTYLILSAEERAKGFVRPVRCTYKHVGIPGPKYPLRDLTAEECDR